jgi:phage terminase small subunit
VLFYLEAVNDVKLTEKQKRFADYYIETGNITEAARKAGYKQPHVQGSQTLEKLSVKTYIDLRLKEMSDKRIMHAEEVMQLLTAIARNEEQEEVVVFGDSGPQVVNKTMSAKDRLKALELIGKRYTLWTDKTQLEGTIGVTIVDDIDD